MNFEFSRQINTWETGVWFPKDCELSRNLDCPYSKKVGPTNQVLIHDCFQLEIWPGPYAGFLWNEPDKKMWVFPPRHLGENRNGNILWVRELQQGGRECEWKSWRGSWHHHWLAGLNSQAQKLAPKRAHNPARRGRQWMKTHPWISFILPSAVQVPPV